MNEENTNELQQESESPKNGNSEYRQLTTKERILLTFFILIAVVFAVFTIKALNRNVEAPSTLFDEVDPKGQDIGDIISGYN